MAGAGCPAQAGAAVASTIAAAASRHLAKGGGWLMPRY
jgi:hypothetical protein